MVGLWGRAGSQCEAAGCEFVQGHTPPPPPVTLPQGRTIGCRHRRVAGSSKAGLRPRGIREGQEGKGVFRH